MIAELHDLRLDFELHANRLERALGRGGAPQDLSLARDELPLARGALDRLSEALAINDEEIPA